MRVFRDAEQDNHATTAAAAPINEYLAAAKAIIAFVGARGGVGKSSILVNVAAALAQSGRKIGILDADLNAPSIVAMLGMKPSRRSLMADWIDPGAGPLGLRIASSDLLPNPEIAPISFLNFEDEPVQENNGRAPIEVGYCATLRQLLEQTRFGSIDALLVDLPSGIEPLLRLAQIAPPMQLIVVTHPSELAARAARGLIEVAAERSIPVCGIIENMAGFNCAGCHAVRPLMPQGAIAAVIQETGVPFMERLPFDPRFAESSDRGSLFVRDYPDSPMAKQLSCIAETINRLFASSSPALAQTA